jgi:hypothetical protein
VLTPRRFLCTLLRVQEEPEAFVQCADIVIQPEASDAHLSVTHARAAVDNDESIVSHMLHRYGISHPQAPIATSVSPTPAGCTTVPQWEAGLLSVGTGLAGTTGFGRVAYDAKGQQLFNALASADGLRLEMHWQNYSAGHEWQFVHEEGQSPADTCLPYPLDTFTSWSYGVAGAETFEQTVQLGGASVNIYENHAAGFRWGVDESNGACIPTLRVRSQGSTLGSLPSGEDSAHLYVNYSEGIRDWSVFDVPAICKAHEEWARSRSGDIDVVRVWVATLKPHHPAHPAASTPGVKHTSSPKRTRRSDASISTSSPKLRPHVDGAHRHSHAERSHLEN